MFRTNTYTNIDDILHAAIYTTLLGAMSEGGSAVSTPSLIVVPGCCIPAEENSRGWRGIGLGRRPEG